MTHALTPHGLDEALRMLSDDPTLIPVAGCTDFLVGLSRPERRELPGVLDLLRVPEIRGIHAVENGLRIGATTTFGEIGRSAAVGDRYPILADAAGQIGGWQIQNRATLGGNVVNASPAGDSLPVLLALGARAIAVGPEGERAIDYAEFHPGYRQTALEPGELLGWIELPDPPALQRFRKVGTRAAQAISKVVVALGARREKGRLIDVRIGAGSVAAVPVRLGAAEAVCEGETPDARLADQAAEAAMGEVTPIDDVRSTADYRRWVLGRVLRRMLLSLG